MKNIDDVHPSSIHSSTDWVYTQFKLSVKLNPWCTSNSSVHTDTAGRWNRLINEIFSGSGLTILPFTKFSVTFQGGLTLKPWRWEPQAQPNPTCSCCSPPCASLSPWNISRSPWEAELLPNCDMVPWCWWPGMNGVYAFATKQMVFHLRLLVHMYASAFQWFSFFPNQPAQGNMYKQPHMHHCKAGAWSCPMRVASFPRQKQEALGKMEIGQ